ncbi:AMP-binding protein [Actinorugispora endophytica]|uniref:O-succinylbenzoic acid--CoA ligase n=1 Tax=Actinorugispora endophytica TaxID=1605990 RepID=A0A4R6V3V1_9ACTN|nr:AMP-binding protein [Actinorugispora endophytica]TDQ53398.1 O-succinylbenzoic acid--CoA ligase [Actinorugispora endophytica]
MSNRPLQAAVGLDPEHLTDLVADALEGRGPAILPIAPDTPAPRTRALVEAMRPASVRTPDGVESTGYDQGAAEDTALTIATSGSTGAPKGVELASAALEHSARASTARIGAAAGQAWLCVLPTAHISGLQVVLRALVTGGRVLHRPFDTGTVMAAAAEHRPHVSLVPTQLRRLLAAGADLSLFRTVLLGGAAAEAGLLDAARAAGARVVTTYGMSETSGGCVYDGVPLDGVDVDVADDGRIHLAGPVLFSGYRLRPDLTREQLAARGGRPWFRTGDLGTVDGRGLLRVRGRVDDVVNTGGHKVVAGEVAALLNRLDSVAEAVVVGRADPEWGQRVSAVVVPSDPAAPPTLAELRDWVGAHLPRYAAPRELDLRPAIPMLASGKPDLRALA